MVQHITSRIDSLIDHMITNIPKKVLASGVIQCPEVSELGAGVELPILSQTAC